MMLIVDEILYQFEKASKEQTVRATYKQMVSIFTVSNSSSFIVRNG